MLTFQSEIHVKQCLTREVLLKMLGSWFDKSAFSLKWLSEKQSGPFDVYKGDAVYSDSVSDLSVSILNDPAFLMVEFNMQDDNVKGSTFCIFREEDGDHARTLYIGEMLESRKLGAMFDISLAGMRAREIAQYVYWNEYQEQFDGCIQNSDRTVFLTGSNLDDYISVLGGADKQHKNPILYVPYAAADITQSLERSFVGQAHIIAEGTPFISDKIKDLLKKEVLLDSIFLKWQDGTVRAVAGPASGVSGADDVVDRIHFGLIEELESGEPDARFIPSRLKESRLLAGTGLDTDLSAAFDSIIGEKDAEIQNLSKEVSILRKKLHDERSKSEALAAGYDGSGFDSSGMFEMTECPKYEHEFEDIILRVLEKERDGMSDDASLNRSRKYHVLCDILAHNFPSDTGTGLKSLIKEVFASGTLTRDGIGRLRSAGFTVEKNDRQAHYKISWCGDDRYVSTYSTTTSDFRSGKNAVSEYINLCFGY